MKFDISQAMKVASVWVVWAFLAIGALGWALFVVLSAFGVQKGMAAWVQAVGSVGAILIAVWISRSEANRVRDEQVLDAFIYMTKADAVALNAQSAVARIENCMKGKPLQPKTLKYLSSNLAIAKAELEEIHFSKLKDHKVSLAFLAIKREVIELYVQLDFYADKDLPFEGGNISDSRARIEKYCTSIGERLQVYMVRHPELICEVMDGLK